MTVMRAGTTTILKEDTAEGYGGADATAGQGGATGTTRTRQRAGTTDERTTSCELLHLP